MSTHRHATRPARHPGGRGRLALACFLALGLSPACPDPGSGPVDGGIRSAAVTRLLDELERNPRRAPPTPVSGTPILATQVTRTQADFRIRILGTADTRLRYDPALPVSSRGGPLPPDFWLVVSSKDGRILYWTPMPDMRRGFAEWVGDQESGAIHGEEFLEDEGMISVRMPFFADGAVELFPGRGPESERHRPVASLVLPGRAPAAPVRTIRRSP